MSHLFCNGYYADVVVLDTMTLTVAFSLVSRATSDWISAMHVIRTPKRSGMHHTAPLFSRRRVQGVTRALPPGECSLPCGVLCQHMFRPSTELPLDPIKAYCSESAA